jgi:uncharacterized membrane protein
MNFQRIVLKTHKWLAVGAGFFTFLWFLSGIVMVMPQTRSAPRAAVAGMAPAQAGDSQPFRQIKVGVPQAIIAAEINAGQSLGIEHVVLRTLAGRLIYEIGTAGAGTFLIDAMDATRVVVNQALARRIATVANGESLEWPSIALLREHTRDYKSGLLPVYRLAANDARATLCFVNADTGEVAAASTRLGRLRTMIVQMHMFGFLLPEMTTSSAAKTMVIFGAVGLLMSVFGGGILVLQLRNWLAARRRTA